MIVIVMDNINNDMLHLHHKGVKQHCRFDVLPTARLMELDNETRRRYQLSSRDDAYLLGFVIMSSMC